MHARENWDIYMELGRGNLGGAEREGGPQPSPAASQLGGRRVTNNTPGGTTTTKRKMDGEEARGGERGIHGRAKWM